MSKADALRKILNRKFTSQQKIHAFDKMRKLAREWLEHMIEEGRSNKYIDGAFKETLLREIWGNDIFKKVYAEMESD